MGYVGCQLKTVVNLARGEWLVLIQMIHEILWISPAVNYRIRFSGILWESAAKWIWSFSEFFGFGVKKRDWRPRETGDFTNAFFFSARKRWDSQPTSHWILGFWSLELGDVRNWWSKKSRIHGFYMVFPTKTAHGLVDWLENLDCKPWLRTMGTGFLQMFPSITSTKVGILKIHPFKALKQWL